MKSLCALREHLGWSRVFIALAAAGQLAVATGADLVANGIGDEPPAPAWINPVPAGVSLSEAAPADAPNLFPGELFAGGDAVPGLEFSLNPTSEEILLGWRVEF